jgi:hypothetical protein
MVLLVSANAGDDATKEKEFYRRGRGEPPRSPSEDQLFQAASYEMVM